MRNSLIVLALLSAPSLTLADHTARAAREPRPARPADQMTPGDYPEKAAAWKRFTVKDVQLGMAVDTIAGLTCDTRVGEYRHTCAQFLDEKCKGLATVVKSVSRASPAPSQACTYDVSNGGTYLNGQYVSTPLINVAVIGTDTAVPRAYEIRYEIAKDALVEESKLSKALVAKYGKPDYTNPPSQMRWNAEGMSDVYLAAECTTEGTTAHCLIQAYDGPLLDAERGIKKAFDDARARNAAPDPKL
ncbi:MAG: hypothetical protein ABIY55_25955 [Kofleriaceae bacterium]